MEQNRNVLFPFGSIERGSKIILYGAGDVGQIFYHQLTVTNYCDIVGWIDKKWNNSKTVCTPFCRISDLKEINYEYIVIALSNVQTSNSVFNELISAGVVKDTIIQPENCCVSYTLCHLSDSVDDTNYMDILSFQCGIAKQTDPQDMCKEEIQKELLQYSKKIYNIAIIGTGAHAQFMAVTVRRRVDNARVYAVCSRNLNKAIDFANSYNIPYYYDSLTELVKNPDIDLVHICTPVYAHYEQVMTCLQHGKNVLCEKPFCVNQKEAEAMVDLARRKKLFLCEGMWPRFLPLAEKLKEILNSGIIGPVTNLTANLFYPSKSRDPLLLFWGKASYLISLAEIVFGKEIREVKTMTEACNFDERRVCSVCLSWDHGIATLNFGEGISDRMAYIYGAKGYIAIEKANEFKAIRVYTAQGYEPAQLIASYEMLSGHEHQLRECLAAIDRQQIESSKQTHETSLFIMNIINSIGKQINIF